MGPVPLLALALLLASTATAAFAQGASTPDDTIRVGSVALRPVAMEVADTVESTFETPRPGGAAQRSVSRSVRRWVLEPVDGESLLRRAVEPLDPVAGSRAPSRFDYHLDPATLAPRRYEQRTPIDSVRVVAKGPCMTGWVHLEREARRDIRCDLVTDRFAGSPIEEYVVAHLPMLRAGFAGVIATWSAIGGPGGYAFRVLGADTLRLRDRAVPTWRVERRVRTDWGPYTTTLWVEQRRARIVQVRREFGNGRVATDVVLNP